ncbi:MAG: hypothetical protein KME02_11185 [Aphanothece saxicola GSE-SYN-MK-01-06B]|jgi:hypothetical protein|nr:hypothetical protein [Aphanothece saxicola GSE-SYN-MK-01-06B]
MSLVSTFELLLKPQLPVAVAQVAPALAPLSRTILLGYFLSIANPNGQEIALTVVLTTRTPGLDPNRVAAFLDIDGVDLALVGSTTTAGLITSTRYTFQLSANDAGLLIIQPDITKLNIFAPNFELRGYVEIFAGSLGAPRSFEILATPEQRGTFFRSVENAGPPAVQEISELGEIAYSLPTANGGSLIRLDREA